LSDIFDWIRWRSILSAKEELLMNSACSNEIRMLYQQLLDGWNKRDANAMAELFTQDGEMIGFDGSQSIGNAEIFTHLEPILENHPTASFVSKVREVLALSHEVAMLRSIAGMVPPGKTDINHPSHNDCREARREMAHYALSEYPGSIS
jgi:uncharacterized protein (TIGR02246 family)